MKTLKSESGITLLALAVTILIMTILIISFSASMTSTIELKKYNNVKEDIIYLSNEIKQYSISHGTLPIYEDLAFDIKKYVPNDNDINPNDGGKYYLINTSLLDIELNYGASNKNTNNLTTDAYLVNEKSLTVYYLAGAVLNGQKHYTLVDTFEGGSFATDYYTKVTLPVISVVTFESDDTVEGKYQATIGSTVTLKIIANYDFATYPTVKILEKNVQVEWNENVGIAKYQITSSDQLSQGNEITFSISNYVVTGRETECAEITTTTFGNKVYYYYVQ